MEQSCPCGHIFTDEVEFDRHWEEVHADKQEYPELTAEVLNSICAEKEWDLKTAKEKIAKAQEILGLENPWDGAAFILGREMRREEMCLTEEELGALNQGRMLPFK